MVQIYFEIPSTPFLFTSDLFSINKSFLATTKTIWVDGWIFSMFHCPSCLVYFDLVFALLLSHGVSQIFTGAQPRWNTEHIDRHYSETPAHSACPPLPPIYEMVPRLRLCCNRA